MIPTEKLQKILAQAGLGSRRQMEQWISDGRVQVNGRLAKLGDRVDAEAKISVDDRLIFTEKSTDSLPQVIIYHKQEGEICTRSDPQQRPTVFRHLPRLSDGRWISVGRLDINTSGLLLFTNDGALANRLMHPSSHIEREYAVRVYGEVDSAVLERLVQGVTLDGKVSRFEHIVDVGGRGKNHWYHVVVTEGRNRLVRRLWESQGLSISRLIRVRFGEIHLGKHPRPGKWGRLPDKVVKKLI